MSLQDLPHDVLYLFFQTIALTTSDSRDIVSLASCSRDLAGVFKCHKTALLNTLLHSLAGENYNYTLELARQDTNAPDNPGALTDTILVRGIKLHREVALYARFIVAVLNLRQKSRHYPGSEKPANQLRYTPQEMIPAVYCFALHGIDESSVHNNGGPIPMSTRTRTSICIMSNLIVSSSVRFIRIFRQAERDGESYCMVSAESDVWKSSRRAVHLGSVMVEKGAWREAYKVLGGDIAKTHGWIERWETAVTDERLGAEHAQDLREEWIFWASRKAPETIDRFLQFREAENGV